MTTCTMGDVPLARRSCGILRHIAEKTTQHSDRSGVHNVFMLRRCASWINLY